MFNGTQFTIYNDTVYSPNEYLTTESTNSINISNGPYYYYDIPVKGAVEETKLKIAVCEYCRVKWIYNPKAAEKVLTRLNCEACGAPLDLV